MYYHHPEERESKEIAPGVRISTFWGDRTLLSIVEVDEGSVVPRHSHSHEQSGIVLEGEIEMGIGEESKVLKQGEMYIIPGNVYHYAKPHNGFGKALDIFSPVRDDYKY